MTETANPRYCPTNWLDEINPLADTPEAFARHVGDGWLLIDPDEETHAETFCRDDLEPGQIVNFARLITHDDFTLIVRDDGSFDAAMPDFPEGNRGFRLPDWDWGDSVDDLPELIKIGMSGDMFGDLSGGNALEPGSYTVECWTWQDTIPFRFEPDGETPKFVLCAGVN